MLSKPLTKLDDEYAELCSIVTEFNKVETDTGTDLELLGKQRRKKQSTKYLTVVTEGETKETSGELEGSNVYREINKKIRKDMKMAKDLARRPK